MATNRFTGAPGASWFDAANWSLGLVPAPGDLVQLFGNSDPDSTAGIVSGVTLDVSDANPTAAGDITGGFLLPFANLNLTAGQLGTASAPVSIEATGDGTSASKSIISFGTLDGSIDVKQGQLLDVAADFTSAGPTVNGDINVSTGATLAFNSYSTAELTTVPATAVTLNGRVDVDGGSLSIFSNQLGGTGSIEVSNGGSLVFQFVPGNTVADTLPIAFGPSGGTLDISGLDGGTFASPISGFGAGATIIGGGTAFGVELATGYANGVLTVADPVHGGSQSFNLVGNYDPADFELQSFGSAFAITYVPTDTYTGPAGGNWFDAANWSRGAVPSSGVLARIYGQASGVDATSGAILNPTIDVSANSQFGGLDSSPRFALSAGQIGTAASPVTIEATGNGLYNATAITFAKLDGSLEVYKGISLQLGVSSTGLTIDGNVSGNGELDIVGTSGTPTATINGAIKVGTLVLATDAVSTNGAGSIDLAGGTAKIENTNPDGADLPVVFGSAGGILDVTANAGGYAGVISGFAGVGGSDQILAPYLPGAIPEASYADGTLTITQPGTSSPDSVLAFHFAGSYDLSSFVVGVRNGDVSISYNPCFATGTHIATSQGDIPVERLAVGDIVHLHDGDTAPVTWIGHRRQHGGAVIRLRPGALGAASPHRDLIVSADHGLYLDGVLVQAGALVNGQTILAETRDEVTFWHVELARHAILFAEGAAAESYLDTGNRRQFANCALSYDAIAGAWCEPCAEMVFAGERLAAIGRRIGDRLLAGCI